MTARKAFTPADLKLDDAGSITVAFAQLNVVDKDGDVTLPGAFPTKAVPMSQYGHTSWDGALPIGKGTIREDGEWAIFSGSFLMDTDQGRNAYQTVKAMADLQEWSYGYSPAGPDGASYGSRDGKSVRFLKRLDVSEVSPVLVGAGVGTHTLAIKSGAPGPDASFAEQFSWYAEGLPALVDQFKEHSAVRAKDGRKLSRTDRARLEDLEAALSGHLDGVRELLIVPESPKAAERRKAEIDVLIGEALAFGVTLG